MPRPVTQDRRRRDIVDAAMSLLLEAEEGRIGIPDVARQLDVTPNAVRYYYPDTDALLWAVRERAEQRFLVQRSEAIAAAADPPTKLVRAMEVGLPEGPDDVEWRVTFRPVMASRFTPEFGELISDVFNRQAEIYRKLVVSGAEAGAFAPVEEAQDVARTLMVMEDYLGFRIVALDPSFSRDEALRLMSRYASLALGVTIEPLAAEDR